MQDHELYRWAGAAAAIAIVTLVISAIALALFFGGRGQFWGPVNDVFISLTVLALLLPIIAVDRLAGDAVPWLRIVTIAAFAGCVVMAVGQLLLVVGVISLEGSYVTGGLGFLPLVVWIVAVAYLALGAGLLPSSVGWWAVATLALIVIEAALAFVTLGPPLWVASVILVVALAGWLWTLSSGLLSRAAA
jgi:hypothetical protein